MENQSTEDIMAAKGFRTPKWVSEKVGTCLSTVYNWIRAGKLGEPQKVGRAQYISVKALIKHLGADTATTLGLGPKAGR